MERRLGITPTVKRYREIKAGVIVSAAGIGVAIFLFVFMQGLLGKVDPNTAQILTRLWIAGVIPFFVGLALIFNGVVVSKRLVELQEREREMERLGGLDGQSQRELGPADTNEFIPPGFSVTEQTTRHLSGVEQNPKQ
jgi:chloramphenicol 3-O-phosphotransferase